MIMRKVVSTETRERIGFAPGGFAIMNTLECGHWVGTKGSAGYANKRRCHECEKLKQGAIVTSSDNAGHYQEIWDPVTSMPKRIGITSLE